MPSAGATRRTRSSRGRPRRRRRRARASSGVPAGRSATRSIRTRTRTTSSSSRRRSPRTWPRAPAPGQVPRRRASPSVIPSPSPSPTPSPSLTPIAEPVSPRRPSRHHADPSPTPSPSPSPEPSPSPSRLAQPPAVTEPEPIARRPIRSPRSPIARLLPDDAPATVEGTVTAALGGLEAGRAGFVQDDGAGIGVYLDAVPPAPIPAGSTVRIRGALDTRFGQRTLRVAVADVVVTGTARPPRSACARHRRRSRVRRGPPGVGHRHGRRGSVGPGRRHRADARRRLRRDPRRRGAGCARRATPTTGTIVTAIGPARPARQQRHRRSRLPHPRHLARRDRDRPGALRVAEPRSGALAESLDRAPTIGVARPVGSAITAARHPRRLPCRRPRRHRRRRRHRPPRPMSQPPAPVPSDRS